MKLDRSQISSYLFDLFEKTLAVCSPEKAVSQHLALKGEQLRVGESEFSTKGHPVYILAVGKASVPMYESAHDVLGEQEAGSLVITPDAGAASDCGADEVITAAHPVPDERSLEAGRAAAEYLDRMPEDALVLMLISGGTSSLMCWPAEGIGIEELNKTYDLLNNSGASIHEINTVRKHCSRIKGGQLLRYVPGGATLIDLIISDVPGDDPAIIGSGPTTPDYSTFQDTYHVLLEYELWDILPDAVRLHIEKGIDGEMPEVVRPEDEPVREHKQYIISSARTFVHRAADIAREDGYRAIVADEPFNDDVEEVANYIADEINSHISKDTTDPQLLLFYGESTVQVTGSGKGGRNQELALRGALKIADFDEQISWLSAGTDGVDGPTDAAGAVVDGNTIRRARERGLEPDEYLRNNDTYHFHERMDTLLKTGPTGNNLMDVVVVVLA
ncbi:glycerate kinase [Fodinibius sp.]|uniref:glycerate kinase type-2 family protein n=1 Tax=Fodinibius sp. TaxID=1872440 RepID=UPI0035663113